MTSIGDPRLTYSLTLGDITWNLSAMPGAESWLEKFAAIMRFGEADISPFAHLTFVLHQPWRPWRRRKPGPPERLESCTTSDDGVRRANLKYLTLWYHTQSVNCVCELKNTRNRGAELLMMWQSLHGIYRGLIERGGFPVHAALLERNGVGVLLIAGEGVGKSTCARRIPFPWKALSDDGAAVAPTDNSGYAVHPFPTWSDLLLDRSRPTWDVQRGIPLAAVFFLERGDRDEVIPVGQGRAAVMINASASYICSRAWENAPKSEKWAYSKKIFLNACEPARRVPAYILRATLDGRFWEQMDKVAPTDGIYMKGYDKSG